MTYASFICCPVANLYVQPDEFSEVISQALYGWTVDVLDSQGAFSRVQTSDGYQGWVDTKWIERQSATKENRKKAKIVFNAAPVYQSPSVNHRKPLFLLPFEVELNVINELEEEEGRWIEVELLEGRSGWIQRGQISLSPNKMTLWEMLELSNQFLGLPYIWGGTSSFGYDCSGFVQMLWRQVGVELPRDASQQIRDSSWKYVERDAFEPGDLIFYGASQERINHVGLYLGRDTLIHASVKPIPIVQRTKLNDLSLQSRYAYRTAKRFCCINHPNLHS